MHVPLGINELRNSELGVSFSLLEQLVSALQGERFPLRNSQRYLHSYSQQNWELFS